MRIENLSNPDRSERNSQDDPQVVHGEEYQQHLIDRGYADGWIGHPRPKQPHRGSGPPAGRASRH